MKLFFAGAKLDKEYCSRTGDDGVSLEFPGLKAMHLTNLQMVELEEDETGIHRPFTNREERLFEDCLEEFHIQLLAQAVAKMIRR